MESAIPAVMIGCGSRAQVHAEAMTRSDAFALEAVCDLQRSRAEDTAERFDVPGVYTDLDEAIAGEAPVHVSAITPPGIRPDVVTAVLEHEPASLITEKPIANDLGGVERIESATAAVDTDVTICHQKVFAEEVRAVKRWIDDGRLGEIERVVGSSKLGLADQGSHFVHTIEWLLGERAEGVRGFAEGNERLLGQGASGHAEPDDATMEITYPGGARAFVHHGSDAPDVPGRPAYLQYRLDVVGSDGHAQFLLGQEAFVQCSDGTSERVDDVPEFDEDAYMTTALYDAQAEVVHGERETHPCSLDDAAAVHRTIDAALRSMLEGRTVSPVERPPPLGRSTNERLEAYLAARQPVCVDTGLPDGNRADALDALHGVGVAAVDLRGSSTRPDWDAPAAVREALSARGLSAPVVTVREHGLDADRVERAADIGTGTVVVDAPAPDATPHDFDSVLETASDHDVTLAFENRIGGAETVADLAAVLDELDHPAAGACLSPLHLEAAPEGESASAAVTTLGADLAVLRVQDAAPGEDLSAQRSAPDSQVPGSGGAVPTALLLDLVVEHAPTATWTFTLEGADAWDERRRLDAIGRAIRHVDANRPV